MIKLLAGFHRWISIVLCLMFAAWFASGIVMISRGLFLHYQMASALSDLNLWTHLILLRCLNRLKQLKLI